MTITAQYETDLTMGQIPRSTERIFSSEYHWKNDDKCNIRASLITEVRYVCIDVVYHFIHLVTDTKLNPWQSQHSKKPTCLLLHLAGLFHQRCYGFIGLTQLPL